MRTALVLIDIQNDYFPQGRMELVGSIEASLNAKKLLETFRTRGDPIIHVKHISGREDAPFFAPNTPGIEIQENVRPLENETIIIKHFPNSFRETELKAHLDKLNIKDIVISGMMSHMCVDATVRAATDFGYNCILVEDACATKDLIFNEITVPSQHVHASFMAALSGTYAKVTKTEEYLGNTSE